MRYEHSTSSGKQKHGDSIRFMAGMQAFGALSSLSSAISLENILIRNVQRVRSSQGLFVVLLKPRLVSARVL